MDNLFELASRKQFRYKVANGTINTEDLWEFSLESLDKLAKSLNKEIKESSEESFIKTRTNANKTLEAKFDIVKHVIGVKLQEAEAKEEKAKKEAKKAQIMELIGRKEIQSLENKSIEELTAELQNL
jgi:hypothetical protein